MSGLGLVLTIAKNALAAQRYGIDVTGHNIANVNTPGYSRQNPVYEAIEPAPYGGVLLGRGVDIDQVLRVSDQFIENQLMQRKSSMLSSKEMEHYINVLEGLFNENSESNISNMLADFWNSWHDIANNPSGASERIALYEHSISMSEQFNTLNADLTQIERDLTNAVSVGIDEINQLTNEIAQINGKIVGMEATNIANDLRDQRNNLVSELSEYLDVKAFEQSNGSLRLVAARGCILVTAASSYDLELGGDSGDRVKWQGSGDPPTTVDITDYIIKGKLGGWLDMRDEVIAKYKLDLDVLAKEFIWSVNEQHSQGVGLQLFSSSVTGTYKTGSSGLLETLTYGNKIDYTKDFKMWTYDSGATSPVPVDIDMAISTADPDWAASSFNTATTYTIEVTQGGTVRSDTIQFRCDIGGAGYNDYTLAAVDTLLTLPVADGGDDSTIQFTNGDVLVAGNTLKINALADNSAAPVVMTPTGAANSISDTYTFTVASVPGDGEIGTDSIQIGWSNSITSGTFTLDAAATPVDVDGMILPFISGYLFAGDVFTITTDADGAPTANLPSEWHWTLDSFVSQFNRQTPRVTASKTSTNALTFTPYTAGTDRELTTFSYSGGATSSNTTVTVNNYDMLTTSTPADTPFTVTQTPAIENEAGTIVETTTVTITTPAEADESVTGIELTWTAGGGGSWAVTQDGGFTGGISIGSVDTATEVRLQLGGSGTDDITVTVTGAGAADTETVTFDINTDNWRVSNVPGAYSLNSGDDIGGDNDGFSVDLNGDGSSDIDVSFATALTADGIVEFDIAAAAGTYSFGFSDDEAQDSGLMAALGINTFLDGRSAGSIGTNSQIQNKDYIAAAQIDANTGDLAVGDNTNALALIDLQYTSSNIAQWTCSRGSAKSSANTTATLEDYYHSTVGSIGIKSASISRSSTFNEMMVNKLSETRDSISAVSLDEEMTNLIKFQHAFAAAAKLISVADEMLNTLLSVK